MTPAKILIIEDDQYLRDLYKTLLTDQGYFVDSASNGNDGFDKIKQGDWDLIILDIILHGISGIEIMKHVKENPPVIPNKKVLFVSNHKNDKEIEIARKLGDDFTI